VSKSDGNKQLFGLYERMDRLEELLEDMDELGIASREEAEQLIIALDRQIDELESSGDGVSEG
jgi:hypothetical protein